MAVCVSVINPLSSFYSCHKSKPLESFSYFVIADIVAVRSEISQLSHHFYFTLVSLSQQLIL